MKDKIGSKKKDWWNSQLEDAKKFHLMQIERFRFGFPPMQKGLEQFIKDNDESEIEIDRDAYLQMKHTIDKETWND